MPHTRIASLVMLAGLASGCAATQAKVPVERPALDVPMAPPRLIEKTAHEIPMPEPVSELPSPPAAPRPRQAPVREVARTEPKPEVPVEPPPAVAAAPTPAPPVLRTPGTADSAGASRQVRDVLERARKTLGSIDYRRLTPERQAQYESAKLMITESEDAVKGARFEYALSLADKVERLTKELQAR